MANLDIQTMTEKVMGGFTGYSGLVIDSLAEGEAVLSMEITPNHWNPFQTVHGGALFTLADVAGGVAARTLETIPTTVTSTISYLRPTFDCKKITGKAKVIKNGSNTIVTQIDIYTDAGIQCAQVMATYFNLKIDDPAAK